MFKQNFVDNTRYIYGEGIFLEKNARARLLFVAIDPSILFSPDLNVLCSQVNDCFQRSSLTVKKHSFRTIIAIRFKIKTDTLNPNPSSVKRSGTFIEKHAHSTVLDLDGH